MKIESTFRNSSIQDKGFDSISDAINAALCRAEALAIIAATVDFDLFNSDIISNYLWVLSDIVHEAKLLYQNSTYDKLSEA